MKKTLSIKQSDELIDTLKIRFEKNMNRHKGLEWAKVKAKLDKDPGKLWTLNEMERTGGEPDVVGYDKKSGEYIYYDCSEESPNGRRSLCFDPEAREKRKEQTSSWLKTPEKIRNLGGAIFGDFRFETVFVYHNGAESYYAGRGFRGLVKI